jgi:hypothetical protein
LGEAGASRRANGGNDEYGRGTESHRITSVSECQYKAFRHHERNIAEPQNEIITPANPTCRRELTSREGVP